MSEINELFFELIRVAIGNLSSLSRQPSPKEWTALYDIAKKQSLVGICFAGMQGLCNTDAEDYCGMPEVLYLTWMGMAAKIQQRNEKVNRQCVEVQKMIEKEGFQTFIMKGQGNSALYNDNLQMLRQSGDIDIYLEGGFEKVNAFVQKTCPTKEINELEIHYYCLPDTEVEIHYRPFIMRNPIKNARLQRFFNETMRFDNKVVLSNCAGSINVPTTEFNLVHQLTHIHLHLFTEGIGMRQLMDYYFVLLNTKDSNDFNSSKIQGAVHDLGLDRFASALIWVIKTVFVDHDNDDIFPWAPCEEDGMILLDEVMNGGNFGHCNEQQNERKGRKGYGIWLLLARNLRLSRFDRWDWFWGPVWRVYHKLWKMKKGFI
ncbi:MAG: nucleotidyltransferase family protein [Bacteroides sp.]|nr:nucleotidyltransferase family protein [Bacteroides sp.]MCM1447176.1 nucleotidyltransferase family protein [Bacteroides sp.]